MSDESRNDMNQPTVSEIIKDIPLPRKQSSRTLNYPFAGMEVGDCFMVSDDRQDINQRGSATERQLRAAVHHNSRRLNKKFSCRRVDADSLGVWRVE
tara:strand:+ start:761 stop:1051 length:291 start_codon:yes stop_codon:yes gene_type:complete